MTRARILLSVAWSVTRSGVTKTCVAVPKAGRTKAAKHHPGGRTADVQTPGLVLFLAGVGLLALLVVLVLLLGGISGRGDEGSDRPMASTGHLPAEHP